MTTPRQLRARLEPLQSNHRDDKTPASADTRYDNNALVSIQVSGAQRAAVSMRPGFSTGFRRDCFGVGCGLSREWMQFSRGGGAVHPAVQSDRTDTNACTAPDICIYI